MAIQFRKATKAQSKLRMTIDGPAGSGKTFTALTFAKTLAGDGKVAVIDTERGSASKYADLFDFDTVELDSFSPQNYIECIKAAEGAGYAVIVIDSLSHAWEGTGGVLDLHDQATVREPGRNSYTAWRSVTPIHNKLVDAMLQSRCHVIATMRSKMDYIQTEDASGKKRIEKVGMAPIQRSGMEYEFDVVADMDTAHNMVVSKSRIFAIADAVVSKPNGEWFKQVVNWLGDGTPTPAPKAEAPKAEPTPEPTVGPNGERVEETFWYTGRTKAIHQWLTDTYGVNIDAVHDQGKKLRDFANRDAFVAWCKTTFKPLAQERAEVAELAAAVGGVVAK